MHISEGVLSGPVLTVGAIMALGGLVIGLRKMQDIALCGMLSAAFFVASLIHIPVGFGNAHLLLTGLCGVLLGWGAFPAIFTALTFQALLFQYGGLTTLGINTASMGYAAVISWYIFHGLMRQRPTALKTAAFLAGFLGIAISAVCTALALSFTAEGFKAAAYALIIAHLPVMLAEGILTMLVVGVLAKIRPTALGQRAST